MTVAAIRGLIEEAIDQEDINHQLHHLIEQNLQHLHRSIRIPEHNQVQRMVDFVKSYVTQVPDFISSVRATTTRAGIYAYAEPFLNVAEAFFLNPPEITRDHTGLDGLMGAAFLANRLIEEVNDVFMMKTGFPLMAMDMTTANLVIHALIGEPYSNELDQAVLHIVDEMMSAHGVFQSAEFHEFLTSHRSGLEDEWPCMSSLHGIELGQVSNG